MRVLHVHSGNLYGGVETFLLSLARLKHLAPSMETSMALCFNGRIAADLRNAGVPVDILGEARLSRPVSIWRARRRFRALLERERPDVVVCHQAWPFRIFGPVARSARLPLVLWVHMAATQHWLERLAWRVKPDCVVCNSRYTASTLPDLARTEVVYYPVMSAGGEPAFDVRPLRTPSEPTVIIQVSRMERWKGQTVCLEALGLLRDDPRWACWQVGGPQRPEERTYFSSLQHQAVQLGIAGRVRFLGERRDVAALLAEAHIYCQPNLGPEPFGISLIEALAAGLPVVTSAAGGPAEIVDSTCGLFVPAGDAAALADALKDLLDDEARRKGLSAGGPLRAKALCEPSSQMSRISQVLHAVVASVH